MEGEVLNRRAESAPSVNAEDAAVIEHRLALQRVLDLEHMLAQRDRLIAEQKAKLQLSKQKILDLGAAVQSLKSRIVPAWSAAAEPLGHHNGGKLAQGGGSFTTRSSFAASSNAVVPSCDASCATDNTEWVLTQLAAKLSSEHEASIVTLRTQLEESEETIRALRRERDDALQVATELRDAQRRRHQWLFDCLKHTSSREPAGSSRFPDIDHLAAPPSLHPGSKAAMKFREDVGSSAPNEAIRPLPLESESGETIMSMSLSGLAAIVGRVLGSSPQHTALLAEQIRQLRQQWTAARRPSTRSPADGIPRGERARSNESKREAADSPSPRLSSPPGLRAVLTGGAMPPLTVDSGRSLLEDLALETSRPMTADHAYGPCDGLGPSHPHHSPPGGNTDAARDEEHATPGLDHVSLRALEMRLEVLRRAEAQPLPETLRRGVAVEIAEIEQRLASHASTAAAALRSAALSYRRSLARHAAVSGGGDAKHAAVPLSSEVFRMRSPSEEGDGS